MPLSNEIALVTGASRGIGKAIATALGSKGATVVGTATSASGAQGISESFAASGIKGTGKELNVTDPGSVEALIKDVQSEYGAPTILVNNAGITRDNLLMRMSEEEWDSVIAVNLKGTFNCIRAATKIFMKQRSGRIINIASVVGQMGNAGQANYASSKAGVIGLTKSVAKEFASRNVLVNAVAPGFIETAMTEKLPEKARETLLQLIPLARLGKPEDVAKVVLFLCSERSTYITGQVINVDGGMVM